MVSNKANNIFLAKINQITYENLKSTNENIQEYLAKTNINLIDESFFIYYHNSFELDQYSSSLYFIDIYKIDNKIFDKKTWNNSNNVTTAILNFENYYDNSSND